MPGRFGPGLSSSLVLNRGSHFKFAELTQANPDTPVRNSTHYSKYYAEFNRAQIDPASTNLRPNRIPTGVEQFRGFPGPFTITGSFTMDAQARRMELLFRQLMNAPTSGITFPTGAANGAGSGTAQTIRTVAAVTQGTAVTTFTNQIAKGQGPVQLSVTTTGSISDTTPLSLTFIGEDRVGDRLVNELVFTSAGTQTTPSYFYQLDSMVPNKSPSGATVGITGTSNRNVVKIETKREYRQVPGMTVEVAEGTYDAMGEGSVSSTMGVCLLNTFGLNFSKDALVTYDFGFVAGDFTYGISPLNTTAQIPPTRTASTGPYGGGTGATAHNYLPFQDGVIPFGGPGACMRASNNGTVTDFPQLENFGITFDNGTAFTNRTCSLYPGLRYNTQRTITVTWTAEFHSDDKDLYQMYLDARTLDDVSFYLTQLGGGNDEVQFYFPHIQFDNFMTKTIEGNEYMMMTKTGTAIPSSSAVDDAMQIFLRYDAIDNLGPSDAARPPTANNLDLADYTA